MHSTVPHPLQIISLESKRNGTCLDLISINCFIYQYIPFATLWYVCATRIRYLRQSVQLHTLQVFKYLDTYLVLMFFLSHLWAVRCSYTNLPFIIFQSIDLKLPFGIRMYCCCYLPCTRTVQCPLQIGFFFVCKII